MRPRAVVAAGLAVVGIAAAAGWWAVRAPQEPTVEAPAPAEPQAAEPEPTRKQSIELKRGDNLVAALVRAGLDTRVGHAVADALRKGGANLKRMKPQDTLEITWNLDGEPISVTWTASPWLGYVAISTADGWTVERSETRPDVRVEAVQGQVDRSLFQAMDDGGGSAQLVLAFVQIFEWDFDFTADTRQGDRFRLLVEKRYAGDAFVDYGRILAAQYLNDGRLLTGVGYEGSDGQTSYYDMQGQSLRKTFLKSPLEFTRITSGFTYARPHPILGGLRPHLAIDYGAPTGTPVRAVADGTVVRAGWDGGFGISILVRHRRGYQTMYNHLSRLGHGIHSGARVNQRQVIGYVGATGLATGPHLDYRVNKNGVWVNPIGERFLPGDPIAGSERTAFLKHSTALVEQLEHEAPF